MRTSNAPQLGMLLLVTSNGLAASVDAIVKYLSSGLHGVQITWGFFLMMFLPVLGYAMAIKKPLRETVKTARFTLQLSRSAMLVLTITTLFISIRPHSARGCDLDCFHGSALHNRACDSGAG